PHVIPAGPPARALGRLPEHVLDVVPLAIRQVTRVRRPCIHAASVTTPRGRREGQFLDALSGLVADHFPLGGHGQSSMSVFVTFTRIGPAGLLAPAFTSTSKMCGF